jgi:hypothetical protein
VVAMFLVGYCLVAWITETGLGDVSPYVLHLFFAALVLAAAADEDRQWRSASRSTSRLKGTRSSPEPQVR